LADLRKDYVLDKFVIVPRIAEADQDEKYSDEEKCPYCPGNESMTEPALLALVAKDGMLQRLSDSEENVIEDWCVRVFQSDHPTVTTVSTTSQRTAITKLLLLRLTIIKNYHKFL